MAAAFGEIGVVSSFPESNLFHYKHITANANPKLFRFMFAKKILRNSIFSSNTMDIFYSFHPQKACTAFMSVVTLRVTGNQLPSSVKFISNDVMNSSHSFYEVDVYYTGTDK